MLLEEEVAALSAENATLREQVRALLARVQELEARLAKDSHNSCKPCTVFAPRHPVYFQRRRLHHRPAWDAYLPALSNWLA
jgi:hypothetical protein